MDIRKFFDTINHDILKNLIRKTIKDEGVLKIIDIVIDSFKAKKKPFENIGVPLGNVTSQIFSNVYLHELDLFVKNVLKKRYYLRYSDDFIILSNDKKSLRDCLGPIQTFLLSHLKLELHPRKISLRKLSEGIDFLGYVIFMKYSLLRVRTKHRLIPFPTNKFINLTRRHHKFLCLEQETIAEWQGAREDQKFVATPTQSNMNLFVGSGIKRRLKKAHKKYSKGEMEAQSMDQRLHSYLGILSHANQEGLSQALKNAYSTREMKWV